jgi:C4-dicarboxylate transporter, DctQ subunit
MVSRYLLPGLALDWTFEVITFLVIWAVFLAAARLVTVGGHIRIDFVLQRVGPSAQRRFALFSAALALAVAILLLWSGVLVVSEAARWGETSSSTLRVPLWIYYLSLPVGAGLMALRLVLRIVGLAKGSVHDRIDGPEAS